SLVRDALDGDELIGMTLLQPGYENDYEGSPPIHPVGGLGRIVSSTPYPDGKFDIFLQGIARFAILEEEATSNPYRVAVAEILEDLAPPPGDAEALELETALRETTGTLHPAAELNLDPGMDLGTLCGAASALLRVPTEERQELLATDDVLQRAQRLLALLSPRAARLRAMDRLIERGGMEAADLN
ncbi:MAG: LON peptidase substrate-binding domain-containing protein, partial [Planctomycetota bacterium]